MRVTLESKAFSAALSRLRKVVLNKNTIPVLEMVRMVAADGSLTLTATDMDIDLSIPLPVSIATPGEICTPLGILNDFIQKLPDGTSVTLALQETRLEVSASRRKISLVTLPVVDFPTIAHPDGDGAPLTLLSETFKRLMTAPQVAMSKEESRYYLCGIFLTPYRAKTDAPWQLDAVATDGHRLVRVKADAPEGFEPFEGIIIPTKTVKLLADLADGAPEIELTITETRLSVAIGQVRLGSKLVDGTYPDYNRVIPTPGQNRIEVSRAELSGAVECAVLVNDDKYRWVRLRWTPDDLNVSSKGSNHQEASDSMEAAANCSGEIAFNARYMLETLKVMSGTEASFFFTKSNDPTLWACPSDPDLTVVTMPVKI